MSRSRISSDTGPFALIPEWVLDLPVSDRAIRLYAILCRYADDQGAAHPSRQTLARRLGTSVPSVRRSLRELVDAGALIVESRRTRAGDPDTNRYLIIRSRPEAGAGVGSRVTLGGVRGDPRGGVTGDATGGVTRDPQNENHRNENASPNGEARAPAARPRDPLWDALAEELGEPATRSERGRRNKALRELREIGATPEEIRRRCALYRSRWPGVELTATALAANWSQLDRPAPAGRGGVSRDALMRAALEGLAQERGLA